MKYFGLFRTFGEISAKRERVRVREFLQGRTFVSTRIIEVDGMPFPRRYALAG